MQFRLRALRINADLRQCDVVKEMLIHRATLVSWETEKTFPNEFLLQDLCQIYHCSVEDVLIPPRKERKKTQASPS